MLKNKIKIFVVVFFAAISIVNSQNQAKIQLDYANTLFNSRQYFDAITEYKRLMFFDTSSTYKFAANLQIALSYKYGGKFDDAINYFSLAERNGKEPKQINLSKLEIIKTNILRKTTDRALQLLDEIEKNSNQSFDRDSLNYWRGWAYMFSDQWDKAAESFSQINYYHPLKILAKNVHDDKYSVTFAKVISYILPGSGQIYTKNYLSGLMSMSYAALFGYLSVNAFIEERAFDGAAIGGLLWLRFYRGNIQNAEKFAVERNLEISNKALNYLQYEYTGSKP